jgi:16S rRNA (guanine527-N7)-methyltransferase
MELSEFEVYFKEECTKNNINIENIDIEKFYIYMREILEWNEKVNVTAIKDEKEFIVKHFIDSLTILEYIEDNKKVLDIGTGAGFPGIPIKIAKPSNKVVLVDSVNKKLNVIRDIIPKISLENIECIHGRAEDLAHDKKYRESFDIVTSRAVANLNTLVEYMLPFLKIGGKIICMKGPNYEEELEQSRKAISILGGKIEKIENRFVSEELERSIIIIKKIKETPKQYPRGQGKPLKTPIK